MAKLEEMKYVNNLENAKKFLDNQDSRKAPNNRVNNSHFLDIANEGTPKLIEKISKYR